MRQCVIAPFPAPPGMRHLISHIRWVLLLCAIWLPAIGTAATRTDTIGVAHDLHADARLAQRKRVPILIVFTRPDCIYCDKVIYHYLIPMQRNPDYADKVLMRRLDITSHRPLTDFRGKLITEKRFATRLKVDFVPTIMVFTPDGKPAGKPLIGLGPEDYYGGFLDQAIEAGRSRMPP
jgi:thioredoxin-related protein